MAQSVKHLTLDLSSGLDLRVLSSSPTLGSVVGVKPTSNKQKKKEVRLIVLNLRPWYSHTKIQAPLSYFLKVAFYLL